MNELEVCMADRKKFWEERDKALAEIVLLKEEINTLNTENQLLAEDLKECQSQPKKQKIDPHVFIADKEWQINGCTVDSNGVVTANYEIIK